MANTCEPRIERLALPVASPGTASTLAVLRLGAPGARPKAYLQASLHADEIPGMLVLERLLARLAAGPQAVRGELVVVPVANPLGLAQYVSGQVLGRFALSGAGNYNRHFPDLTEAAASRLGAGRLGAGAAANTAAVRAALGEALAALPEPRDDTEWLRRTLLGLALDADLALDLHCDEEALLHLYTGTPLWPQAAELSAQLGSRATLLAEASGGDPFDEALSSPWWRLARRFAPHPLPCACLAATVELRGHRDVDDATAERDAGNLLRLLERMGVVEGDPGPLPEPLCSATPLEAADLVRAPAAGVVSWLVPLGARVRAGERVAELADPLRLDSPGARVPVAARAEGLVFARTDRRIARPGEVLVKIAGSEPLAHRRAGDLLTP